MTKRGWTAAFACIAFALALWLSVVPYQHRLSIGRPAVSGRCPPAVTTAFRRVPDSVFFDLAAGERLPAEVCVRSARRRLALGVMFGLLGGAVLVAGRTTWERDAGDT